MRSIAMVRGVLGTVITVLLCSAGCSSSDPPATTSPEAGAAGKSGLGGTSGNAGTSGKAGSAGSNPATGGKGAGAAGDDAPAGSGGMAGDDESAGDGGSAGDGRSAGDGGSAGEPAVDPCAACASGACLPDGTCVECLDGNDHCAAGTYCGTEHTCVPGCKDATSCASGVCGATHDCASCISDLECSSAHVCGAQQCAAACSAQQEGGNAGCGTGLTCCSLHCVDVNSDSKHCGACGTACSAAQFCGESGCVNSAVSSLCEVAKVVVVLDGQTGDDPVGRAVAQMLVAQCPSPPAVREVVQSVPDAINPANGRPVAGGDELIVIAGGNAVQSASYYLASQKVAPLNAAQNSGNYQFINTSSNAVVASEPVNDATDSHDLFVVEFVRDATSDSIVLNTYGFNPGGTAAASVYLDKALLPNLATSTKSWYVGEWTDADADKTPDFNEITLLDSGS